MITITFVKKESVKFYSTDPRLVSVALTVRAELNLCVHGCVVKWPTVPGNKKYAYGSILACANFILEKCNKLFTLLRNLSQSFLL